MAGPDVETVVVQFKPGDGQIHRLKPRQPAEVSVDAAQPQSQAPERNDEGPVKVDPETVSPVLEEEIFAVYNPPAPESEIPAQDAVWSEPPPAPYEEPLNRPAALEPERTYRTSDRPPVAGVYLGDATPRQPVSPQEHPAEPSEPVEVQPARQPFKLTTPQVKVNVRKPLASIWRAGRSAGRKVDTGRRTVTGRLLPSHSPALSPGTMLFIAIAIPLLIVASAVTVYFYAPSGRNEQQQAYIAQALAYVEQASAQSDPVLVRNNWDQVFYWLDMAEEYGRSDETIAIRRQARSALDAMDGVNRLILEPALIGGLPNTVRITHIVASPAEVFALDAEEGRVLRLFKTARGYELDTKFSCGPGPSGTLIVSPLVDIELLPASHSSSVLAVDRTGNLLYCTAGEDPLSVALAMPDPIWGEITTMTIDQGILYLLDKPNNRIWLYVGANYVYSDEPRLFFNDEVPQLNDVVDMVANNEDLYLLHDNGIMTTCIFRSFSFAQTRCTDPSLYNDQRLGRSFSVQTLPGTQFIQMQTTSPPILPYIY
jgi:hypothetical protein